MEQLRPVRPYVDFMTGPYWEGKLVFHDIYFNKEVKSYVLDTAQKMKAGTFFD